jgi:uncharacterized protein YjbJ (UPF0337 family)
MFLAVSHSTAMRPFFEDLQPDYEQDVLPTRHMAGRRDVMDKEHVKGAADKAKGAIKDAAGKVTGDKELQAEGKMDKAKGAAHSAVGDAKDAVKNATK